MAAVRLALPFLVSVLPVLAQTLCEPSSAVRRQIALTSNLSDYSIPFEERMRGERALLAQFPSDLFAQRHYQDRFRRLPQLYAEFDRALAMYRGKPGDPVYSYLAARLTGSFDAPQAEALFVDQIARHPAFPWPHLGIVELTDRLGARDAPKAESHLRAFLAACPSSPEGYALLRTVEDPELIRQGATQFRLLLAGRTGPAAFSYWPALWTQELRAAPQGGEGPVRRRILDDAETLKKLPPEPSMAWYLLFRSAADLTKDPALSAWLDQTILQRFPRSSFAAAIERTRWAAQNPRPGRDATSAERAAFAARERAWNDELAARFPGDYETLLNRWQAVEPSGQPRPLEQRLAIAEAYAAMARRSPDAGSATPPWRISLANYYVRWGVRLAHVAALVEEGLRDAELEAKYKPVPAMYPEAIRGQLGDGVALSYWRALLVLADLYLTQKQPAEAREAIAVGVANVEGRPVLPAGTPQGKQDASFRRGTWLVREARLAALTGDAAQALSLYRQYAATVGRQGLANARNSIPEIQDTIEEARRAYLAGGGSEEAWLDWATASTPSEPGALRPAAPEFAALLPEFRAKDLNGRTWTRADLEGKATLVDLWASWCGPCRAEHPALQQLYEKIKDRRDIQILTISLDDAPAQSAAYLAEQHYSFPAIASKDLAEKLFPLLGLPQHWIVDRQGRRSAPYLVHPSQLERILTDLEKAAQKP